MRLNFVVENVTVAIPVTGFGSIKLFEAANLSLDTEPRTVGKMSAVASHRAAYCRETLLAGTKSRKQEGFWLRSELRQCWYIS